MPHNIESQDVSASTLLRPCSIWCLTKAISHLLNSNEYNPTPSVSVGPRLKECECWFWVSLPRTDCTVTQCLHVTVGVTQHLACCSSSAAEGLTHVHCVGSHVSVYIDSGSSRHSPGGDVLTVLVRLSTPICGALCSCPSWNIAPQEFT